MKPALRDRLFRITLRAVGAGSSYRDAVHGGPPFPRPTDPKRVGLLLDHARHSVPFYAEGLPPLAAADPLGELRRLGFRTRKEDVKEDVWRFMDRAYGGSADALDYKHAGLRRIVRLLRKDALIETSTSGSTGRPLHFYRSKESVLRLLRSILEALRHLGWQPGDAIVSAWQTERDAGGSGVHRAVAAIGLPIFCFSGLDEQRTRDFLDLMRRTGPAVLFGFPSYYLELAAWMRDLGLRFERPPRLLLCGGEVLRDEDRRVLEDAFETRVYNSYGSNELGFVATECVHRTGLHVLEHSYVVQRDETGQLLVTTLEQLEMPLIRYEIGDRAELRVEACPCGVTGTKIVELEGRTEDYLLNARGQRVYARFFRESLLAANHAFGDAVEQASFHQTADRSIDFRLRLARGFEREAELIEHLARSLEAGLGLQARGASAASLLPRRGKFRFLSRESAR
ncbi:MAG: AMP-binding protein [Planctomycetota bacterium]